VLILLTGNYTFFNWLTIALCVPLRDDFFLRRVVRRRENPREYLPPVSLQERRLSGRCLARSWNADDFAFHHH
jgi:hypothetical protein